MSKFGACVDSTLSKSNLKEIYFFNNEICVFGWTTTYKVFYISQLHSEKNILILSKKEAEIITNLKYYYDDD